MTIYRLTITKRMIDGPWFDEPWSNVYHVNAASAAAMALVAPAIVDLEKTLYPDNVRIFRYSIGDPLAPNTGFSTGINESGNRSVGAVATQLPLWNVVVAKLLVPTGRPSLKYLRPVLDESEVDSGIIVATLFNAINDNYLSPLVARGDVTDEDGQAITGALLDVNLRNRQQGWHRRTRSGFHRGWVPD